MMFVLVGMFNIVLGSWLMIGIICFYFGFWFVSDFGGNYFKMLYVVIGWCFMILIVIMRLIWGVNKCW